MNRIARPFPPLWPIMARSIMDAMMLLAACTLAFMVAGFISEVGRGVAYLNSAEVTMSRHLGMFGVFGGLALLTFWQRGHYTQRLPWWFQVREIVLVLLILMLLQGFLHYSFKYPLSRLWVGGSWLLAIPLVIVGRLLIRQLLQRLGHWGLKTLIIGGQEAV